MVDNCHFRLIAITPETPVDDEGAKITALLTAGFFRVHLRHPSASRIEMRDIIEAVPQRLHDRIVIHGHFDLAFDYNLGGLHLNRRCPAPPAGYRGALSRSCHSVDEVISHSAGMGYVTLSPVFDSISKAGYRSAISSDDISRLPGIPVPVIALGGITPASLPALAAGGFAGAAMLGAIGWERPLPEFSNKLSEYIC